MLVRYNEGMTTVTDGDFEWDSEKAESNLAKHGVTFGQAIVALTDKHAIETADLLDSSRVVTFGFEPVSGVLLVVTTEVADRTRIISARPATPAQSRRYHEG